MSITRKGLSPSDEQRENRLLDFERLLGQKEFKFSCAEMKEVLSFCQGKEKGTTPWIFLDVREEWEHRFVRFPDSLFISLSRLPENLHRISNDSPVVVYCHTGIRSLLACYLLEQNDYRHIRNLEGGIDAYARFIEPRLPRYHLEPGRRPPLSVLRENDRGEEKIFHNPWGEGVLDEIFP